MAVTLVFLFGRYTETLVAAGLSWHQTVARNNSSFWYDGDVSAGLYLNLFLKEKRDNYTGVVAAGQPS